MADAGFFRGTSIDQDSRFANKEKKLLKTMKFEPVLSEKVDFSKVNMDSIKGWVNKRVTELAGFEDEMLVDYVFNQLEESDLDPRQMQINLTGFMHKNAKVFMKELWEMLVSAQSNSSGIPTAILEAKKQEITRAKEEKERLQSGLRRHNEQHSEVAGAPPPAAVASRRRSRSRSQSPRRRSRSPPRRRSRSRSPARRRRSRSRSPARRRSRSPPRRRSRSRSPARRRRSPPRRRSRSPPRHRSRSRSPAQRRPRKRTPTPSSASSSSSSSSRSPSPKNKPAKRTKSSSPSPSLRGRKAKPDQAKARSPSASSSSSRSPSPRRRETEGRRAAESQDVVEQRLREKALESLQRRKKDSGADRKASPASSSASPSRRSGSGNGSPPPKA
eukprot:m.72128 g.72128  ORF g.72128 m.72128 type:complete len:387 (-) comp12976_c0_seq2:63-1223(-)